MKYSDFVAGLIKSPLAIGEELTPDKIDLWHMATGIAGECGEVYTTVDHDNIIKELGDVEFYLEGFRQRLGLEWIPHSDKESHAGIIIPLTMLVVSACELLDEVKKHVINNKELNIEKVKKVLVKIEREFYMIRQYYDITREEVIEGNMKKLDVRYPDGYSDSNASIKLDKDYPDW